MKKITLLFLALSSLALAAAYPSGSANVTPTSSTTKDTAGININVSAIVTTSTSTQLEIVDETGTQISDVNFYHILTQDKDNNLGGEKELTQSIYAKAPGLTDGRKGKLTNSTLNTFTSTDDNNFSSNVTVSQEGFDTTKNGVEYILTSIVAANGELIKDRDINTLPQLLTFTYDKTK